MLCGYKDGTLGDCLALLGLVLAGTVLSYYWYLPRGKCALRPLFLCLALVPFSFYERRGRGVCTPEKALQRWPGRRLPALKQQR